MYIYIYIYSQILHIYIYIYIILSSIFIQSWIVFFHNILAECIKISIMSSCPNIDFFLINASCLFTNIVIYSVNVIKTDFVQRACDDYFVFSCVYWCDTCYFNVIIMIYTLSLSYQILIVLDFVVEMF